MGAINTFDTPLKRFIARLKKDYPNFKFKSAKLENWSPKTRTISFDNRQPEQQIKYGLLHELAHEILEQKNYSSDLELLKMEAQAWHLAAKIGRKYRVKINEEHIQNCLDTYRDWLHKRSECPICGMHVIQQNVSTYKCFNCGQTWQVSVQRFARPYRTKAK